MHKDAMKRNLVIQTLASLGSRMESVTFRVGMSDVEAIP